MSIGPSFMLNSLRTQLTQLPGQTMKAGGTQLPNQHLQILEPLKFSATQWNRWNDGHVIPDHFFRLALIDSSFQATNTALIQLFRRSNLRRQSPKSPALLMLRESIRLFLLGENLRESDFNMRLFSNKTWSSVGVQLTKSPVTCFATSTNN